tara:strand:+ start:107 stop:1459 length:1353 start_codon:yes stop_codon:yes gene_type:complete
MFFLKFSSLLIITSFLLSDCPEGFYEDECGNCWMPYCYNYINHQIAYDMEENSCLLEDNSMWVIPGDVGDPYFNNYCNECPDGFYPDDCGHCWQSFCYTFFSPGLDGDPAHSVYYDLTLEECEEYGYSYYNPNHPSNPYWNSNCETDCNGDVDGYAMVDDCGDCQPAYCYDYVTHEVNFDFPCDGPTEMLVMPDDPSNPYWNSNCGTDCIDGDVNQDNTLDILDVVAIVTDILDDIIPNQCADINQDGSVDIMDVVQIVSIILNSRSLDATDATLNINKGFVSLDSDGFIGAVQIILNHNDDFEIQLTSNAMIADYRTNKNITRIIIIVPEGNELFRAIGDFSIDNLIVTNSNNQIDVNINIPSKLALGEAYPNPFNPSTSFTFYALEQNFVDINIYNVMGQLVDVIYSGDISKGEHLFTWNAYDISTGIYLIKATSNFDSSIQKVMLIK